MKWGRIILIVFGALIITALGIDAADTFTGSRSTLLSQVISRDSGRCPLGMSEVSNSATLTCVDTYEVSAGKDCPVQDPSHITASQQNIGTKACLPESKKDATPWRFITRDQAMQMCARAGNRLPTSEEWYTLSLGMSETERTCNVASKKIETTGSYDGCVSPHGAHDLVGNVWEWVSDDVIDGVYNAISLPSSGYVAQVGKDGMATVVSESPQELFEDDYFWMRTDGAYGIIRGGYYDSGSDAGIYAVHADTPPTTAGTGIGFRCVR